MRVGCLRAAPVRARASANRQIRGCRVTVDGLQGPVDLFMTA
jgi:hypothetical protein